MRQYLPATAEIRALVERAEAVLGGRLATARQLRVSDVTLRRIVTGRSGVVSDGLLLDLIAALRAASAESAEVADALEAASEQPSVVLAGRTGKEPNHPEVLALHRFEARELEAGEAAVVEAHVAGCGVCQAYLRDLRDFSGA